MRSSQFFRSREFLDLEKTPARRCGRHRGWDPARNEDSGPAHYCRPDNARRLCRFLVPWRGSGRADEMGGDRSPAPCGGTWGCAAPRDEPGATRNCSGREAGGERARRVSREFSAESVQLRCETPGGILGEGSPPGRVSSGCGLASREIIRGQIRALGLLCQFDPKFCHRKQGDTVLFRHRGRQVLTFLCVSPVGLRVVSHHWPFPT
jgi:hypothetical protein